MNLTSRLIQRQLGLDPPLTRDLIIERDLPVPMRADGYSLETPFGWGVLIAGQERRLGMLRGLVEEGRTRRAMSTLPLAGADVAATGRRSTYIQDILDHDADDPYWAAINHRDLVAGTTVPVSSVGGWYDIFLPGQLRDFAALQQAGRTARLTVGPWTHLSLDGAMMREALEFGSRMPAAPSRLSGDRSGCT